MKWRIITIIIVLVVIFLVFRYWNNKPEHNSNQQAEPITLLRPSGQFNKSFAALLQAYYQMTDALVSGNTVLVNDAASELHQKALNINLDELKTDSSGLIWETAGFYSKMVSATANSLFQKKTLEDKRKEFNALSDAMWTLTRIVRYDGEKVYYQYCPMAFDDEGAYWMSNSRKISNPYFGEEMLTCGEVRDSLDYSKQ